MENAIFAEDAIRAKKNRRFRQEGIGLSYV